MTNSSGVFFFGFETFSKKKHFFISSLEQIVDVHVSQDVGQVFEAPKISSQDRNLQCTVGQILDVLLLEKAERLVEVPETVSQDRLQQRTVEEIVGRSSPAGLKRNWQRSSRFYPRTGFNNALWSRPFLLLHLLR